MMISQVIFAEGSMVLLTRYRRIENVNTTLPPR